VKEKFFSWKCLLFNALLYQIPQKVGNFLLSYFFSREGHEGTQRKRKGKKEDEESFKKNMEGRAILSL
jgi:hypothetical protein